ILRIIPLGRPTSCCSSAIGRLAISFQQREILRLVNRYPTAPTMASMKMAMQRAMDATEPTNSGKWHSRERPDLKAAAASQSSLRICRRYPPHPSSRLLLVSHYLLYGPLCHH